MLILVLWMMGMISAAVGALTVTATHDVRLGRVPFEVLQRHAIAQAAVQQAMRVIQQDTQESPALDSLQESWATGVDADGRPLFEHVAVGEGTFSIGQRSSEGFAPGLIDEERKLNLRTATLEQLQALILVVQPDGVDAQAVATAIVDWRDEPVGSVCQGATPPCHNGPFDSVDELRAVPGVTADVFNALEPAVTIYGSGAVNVNTAEAIVLDALGCPGEQYLQQRKPEAHGPFTAPPTDACSGLTVTSSVFTVPVEVELPGNPPRAQLRAVIDRTGKILTWHPQ